METVTKKSSFRCAYEQVPHGKIKRVRKELREVLGLKTDAALFYKINGDREVSKSQSVMVEDLFKKYGITVKWGCEEPVKEEV